MDVMNAALAMPRMSVMPDIVILSSGARERAGTNVNSQMIDALKRAGFQLRRCALLEDVFSAVVRGSNAIVVIDAGQHSEVDGFMLASGVRANFEGGIVLFAGPTSEDRARGLNRGADVVLSPQTRPSEVIAYLYALHRRIAAMAGMPAVLPPQKAYQAPDRDTWVLEQEGWFLRTPDGARILLGRGERTFLMNIFEDAGNILRRDRWFDMQDVRPRSGRDSSLRSIDVLVSRLRCKVEAVDARFPLRARRGIGYQFMGKCFVDYDGK